MSPEKDLQYVRCSANENTITVISILTIISSRSLGGILLVYPARAHIISTKFSISDNRYIKSQGSSSQYFYVIEDVN